MIDFWQKLNKPIIALAPMAGITDSAFRLVCKKFGADVVYSEMVSAEGLFYKSEKTRELLKFNKSAQSAQGGPTQGGFEPASGGEKPIVIQLFGKNPAAFASAAAMIGNKNFCSLQADGIDINFGCPARKVYGHGGGASLMNQPKLAREIIKAVVDNSQLPISIKFRAKVKNVTALDFIKAVKNLPIACVMVHGRAYEQGFSGPIDYEMIKKVKQNFKGLVLANGGIKTPEDAKIMLEKTGADGLGLAQGVLGKPWLFKQVKDYLETGEYKELEFDGVKKIALSHAKLMYKLKPDQAPYEMRKYLAWYFKGFSNASELRKKLMRTSNLEEVIVILEGPAQGGDR
ncbi:MAG: tRNA-dihydrouridine synthase [bacterium]